MDAHDIVQLTQLRPGRHIWFARIPFALTAVGGGIVLIALKALGIDQLYVTAVAIAFILLYVVTVNGNAILRLREDQLADNCYYLGFLYTLFSVSWALYEFAQSGDEAGIIANFGLALGSTIAGVLLRVVLNQARKDVIETEADARMELAQAVVRLRVQIDDAVLAIHSFCKQTEQIASDSMRATAERASTALQEGASTVSNTSAEAIAALDTAFSTLTEHSSELSATSSSTVRALKSLLSRIEKIDVPSDLLTKRIEPVLLTIDAALVRIRQRMEQEQQAFANTSARATDIQKKLGQTADQMAGLVGSMSDTTSALGRASTAATEAVRGFTSLGASLDAAVRHHQEILAQIKRTSDQFAAVLAQDQAVTREHVTASLNALLTAFKTHNDGLEEELARSKRMTAEVGNAFADLAEAVTARARVSPIQPIAALASRATS